MARRLMGEKIIPRLSLDEIAWEQGAVRKPLNESLSLLQQFMDSSAEWIIEGCYSDLLAAALPLCTELRFLNPGVAVCVAHCHERPWEPEKFASPEEQHKLLDQLVQWVSDYETREDEYGLKRHRQLFDNFQGPKKEYTRLASYNE